jgi:spermidine synthase
VKPWETLDAVDTDEGRLELRRRGETDFVITVAGRVLMNSAWHRSEIAVAQLACRRIKDRPRPRVLIGGLGMGYTLRAALDELPRTARVVVAEIEPAVVRWCRGPLAPLTERAVDDPRTEIVLGDVAQVITDAGRAEAARFDTARFDARFDTIVLDLYEGPRTSTQAREDPFWGPAALRRTRDALTPGGVFSVWSEDPDAAFEKRLAAAGFRVERRRPESGGPRHAVYLGERT